MKKLLPIILSVVLVCVLAVVTVMLDQGIDRPRLEEVASIPDYVPTYVEPVTTEPGDGEHSKAPNITVTDAQGQTVTLDMFQGKPVVINFWASWAGPSMGELSMYQQAYNDYSDQVYFLMINVTSDSRETRESADALIKQGGFTLPFYYDLDASAANTYEVISVPTSFFIDANGKAVAYAAGEIDRSGFELGLQACLRSAALTNSTAPTDETTPTTK